MPAKNKRRDAKRDANEPEIVRGLEERGFVVHRIDDPGDLLVWHPDKQRWAAMEVKMPDGKFTPAQKKYRNENPDVHVPVVRSVSDALAVMVDL